MNPRLIMLVLFALGLAVYFAVRPTPKPGEITLQSFVPPKEGSSKEEIRLMQKTLSARPLSGKEPDVPPEFNVNVEVDEGSGKNRLRFYITEAHGYYAESFWLEIWFTGGDDSVEPNGSPLKMREFFDRYLKANDTLSDCMEIVPPELKRAGGLIGDSSDWAARVIRYGRARLTDPEELPAMTTMPRCE